MKQTKGTRLVRPRTLFLSGFIANLAVTLITLVVLPGRVAIHFGAHGAANGWASGRVNALIMTSVHLLIFCSFAFAGWLVGALPARWINLPHREYWLSPARRPQTADCVQIYCWRFGGATFLLLLAIGVLSLRANQTSPVTLNMQRFYAALGAYALYTVYWLIDLHRAFRLPPGAKPDDACTT